MAFHPVSMEQISSKGECLEKREACQRVAFHRMTKMSLSAKHRVHSKRTDYPTIYILTLLKTL